MPSKLTYKQSILLQRIQNQDWTAVEEIWPTLTTEPFNQERPLEDIINDVAEKIRALVPEEEKPKPKPPTSEDLSEMILEAWTEIRNILDPKRKK